MKKLVGTLAFMASTYSSPLHLKCVGLRAPSPFTVRRSATVGSRAASTGCVNTNAFRNDRAVPVTHTLPQSPSASSGPTTRRARARSYAALTITRCRPEARCLIAGSRVAFSRAGNGFSPPQA